MKTAREISQMLAERAEDVARHLFPQGKREGHEWCVGSIEGEAGKSLKIRVEGLKSGLWADFATGGSGDMLDLWSLRYGLDFGSTLKEARSYLGITVPTFENHKQKGFSLPKKQNLTPLSETSPVMRYLTERRKLSTEIVEKYKIAQEGENIIFPYLRDGKIVFNKYISLRRNEGKKIVYAEKDCEPCLFGWHMLPTNARHVTICEGEIDAMTLHQYGVPALSVPFGAGTGRKHSWVEHEFERLSVFDEIYLCFDNDEEGQRAAIDLSERLGAYRCKIVTLPEKDANDCLKKGISTEIIQYCFKEATTFDPTELRKAKSFLSQTEAEFYPVHGMQVGYHPPWAKSLSKVFFRPSELNIWTGINGHGKSQFLGHVILSMMQQGAKVCVASLELKPQKFLWRLTRQATSMAMPSREYVRAVFDWYDEKLLLFDLLGNAKSQRLLDVFIYARQRYGIDVFVIDSFMKLDIAEDDYKGQKSFIEKICDFKNQYNCQVHIISHPRKGADETATPGKLDTKGTGAITDLADNCFSVWRNKEKERCVQKKSENYFLTEKEMVSVKLPDCTWRCDKQRNGDWEGSLWFWFDKKSFQYLENENSKPASFVEFSILSNNEKGFYATNVN
jgi:twinkle protein